MNTGKQINAMVVVLFALLIAVGAYTVFDPYRSDEAEDEQLFKTADRGAESFALNCRLCHGDRGQGGLEGGRFAGAAVLDKPDLQGIDAGAFSEDVLEEHFQFVSNTIACGRVGQQMPAWAEAQGGTLNDEQIRQLATLITYAGPASADVSWELAQEHADEIDAEATGHAHVDMPDGAFAADDTELIVSNASQFSNGQYIRIEVDEETEERMRILPRQVAVDRGVSGTEVDDHSAGAEIFRQGEAEAAGVLSEDFSAEAGAFIVVNPDDFEAGDTLIIEDEQIEVVEIEQGIPTTGHALVQELGREPDTFLVSSSENIEVGQIIRLEGELMEVLAIGEDGETGIEIDADGSATASEVSVSDPVFFARGYTFRSGDEWMEVLGPVETGQVLFDTVGRAESTLFISGTEGIEEGMIVRMGSELIRIDEIVSPARIEITRGAEESTASSHSAGEDVLALEPPPEGEEGEPEQVESGQTLLEGIDDGAEVASVTGTDGIPLGGTIALGDELLNVTNVLPAEVRVTRAVGEADEAPHPRRSPLYVGNLLEVERGVLGSSAASHASGDGILMTELTVERSVEDSPLEAHSKNVEIFLGNSLIVERGLLQTEPADHENGSLVLDFPLGPTDPPVNTGACGQTAGAGAGEEPEDTPLEGAAEVDVSLFEWGVTAEPESVAAQAVNFNVTNIGASPHNFRVLLTDIPADQLPVDNNAVIEDAEGVQLVGGFTTGIQSDVTRLASELVIPGNYVLICNIPTHYEQGMFTSFTVTAP